MAGEETIRTLTRIFFGTALALVAFEPIARVYYFYPGSFEPGVGPVPAPASKVRWCIEGCATSSWQDHDLRRSRPYDPRLPAILAVGDSHTEAMQVGDDEVYTARLERALGDGTQVLNIGRSGHSPADHVALAARNRALFSPEWTIVVLKEKDFQDIGTGAYHFV